MSKQISNDKITPAADKSTAGTDSVSDTDEELFCPLCVEEIDASDKNFLPCPCGYRVSFRLRRTFSICLPSFLGLHVVLASYP